MHGGGGFGEWEANTERRLNVLEQRVDKLYDPEFGIYSKMTSIESRLKTWAIALLTAIVAANATVIILLATHTHA